MTPGYDLIAETLAARSDDIGRVEAALRAQQLELPSWAFGNSGTRFAVFSQPGVPRDPFEKLADAAEVHRVTGIAPSVALHIPWDRVDDYDKLSRFADDLGVRLGTINSNTFQDDDYKFGSLTHVDERIRAKAVSLWLRADADVIMRRVRRRADRPLLQTADPEATVHRLLGEREPVYRNADLTVFSRDVPHDKIVDECIEALYGHNLAKAELAQALGITESAVISYFGGSK